MKKILFTGGGSAGHVIPNVALIQHFLSTGEADVAYIGTDGIEKELITPFKIPYFTIRPPKLIRSFSLRNLTIPHRLLKAKREAKRGLLQYQPDLVFSKGGFVALPVILAACDLKIPCITHESDLSMGLANRLMAKKCTSVLTAFPETAEKVKKGKFVGNPIREELLLGDRQKALEKYGFSGKRKILLVFGGGSGAKAINEVIRKEAKDLCKRYDILHICGKGNQTYDNVKGYKQIEFERDMQDAYAVCDGVIARGGSNTLFEILAVKKPAIIVPLAHSSRGDQVENARYFQQKGLIQVLNEEDLETIEWEIEDLFRNQTLRDNLALCKYSYANRNIVYEIQKYL